MFSRGFALESGQAVQPPKDFEAWTEQFPWIQVTERSPVTLLWPQDLLTARELRHGRIPLWDPCTGRGVPTLDCGFYRPINPFRLPFYIRPTAWAYCLGMALCLLFDLAGFYRWVRPWAGEWPATLGLAFFALNPRVLEDMVPPEVPAYFILPWCLRELEGAAAGRPRSLLKAGLGFVLMGHASHPEAAPGVESPARDARRRLRALAALSLFLLAALAVLWLPPLKLYALAYLQKKADLVDGFPFA